MMEGGRRCPASCPEHALQLLEKTITSKLRLGGAFGLEFSEELTF